MKRSLATIVSLGVLLAGCGGSSSGSGSSGGQSQEPKTLTIAAYGGSFEKNFKERVLPEFEKKHNVKIKYVTGVSSDTVAKLKAQKDRPEIDVAIMDDGPQVQAKALGLFDKLDPAKVPNLQQIYDIAKDADNVGVGIGVVASGIGYNTKYFKDNNLPVPTSWNDLLRPEFKGKVVLQSFSNTYGVHMAVMLARANGGGEKNIDPGFKKAQEAAKLAITFEKNADVGGYFQQGQAVIAPWGSGRVYTLAAQNFPIEFVYPKEGAPALFVVASPVKNAPNKELAQTFINFLLDELAQKVAAEAVFYGPVNKNVKLPDDIAKKVPYGEAQFKSLTKVDWTIINENRADWSERWSKEIEK